MRLRSVLSEALRNIGAGVSHALLIVCSGIVRVYIARRI